MNNHDFKLALDGSIVSMYIEYQFKPVKSQVITDLNAIISRLGQLYKHFKPVIAIVYPYVFGWTRGYKIHYSTDSKIPASFYDERHDARTVYKFENNKLIPIIYINNG